jgi:hypothetical protein
MNNPAILVRPKNVKTSAWVLAQSEAIRFGTGRRLGVGCLVEALLNAIMEAGLDFRDCLGMSDISARLVKILNSRFTLTDAQLSGRRSR